MGDMYCSGCNKGCSNAYAGSAAPSPNDAYLNPSNSSPSFESGLEREAQSGTIESAREDVGVNPGITGTNYEAGESHVYGSGVAIGNNYGTFEVDKEQSTEREITDLLEANRETNAQAREVVSEASDSNASYSTSFNQGEQSDFGLESSVNLLKRFGYEDEE